MIEKKIHYIWLGDNPKNDLILACIQSWRNILTDYEIIEWNEDNLDIEKLKKGCDFFKKMYEDKAWAFASDYLRLKILREEGGIYLDTDMLVLKSFNQVLDNEFFVGYEDVDTINAAIIGTTSDSIFLRKVIEFYEKEALNCKEFTIPQILTKLYLENSKEVKTFSEEYFYPLPFEKKEMRYEEFITEKSIAVHLWNHSWGSNKVLAKVKTKNMKGVKKYIYYFAFYMGAHHLYNKLKGRKK